MRKLKFRAWDGYKMRGVDMLVFNNCDFSYRENNSGNRFVNLLYQPSVKVMQYTGLKDNRAKEIYEGDILSIWDECLQKKYIVKVVFEDGTFKVKSEEIESVLYFKLGKFYTTYIIGNIYENKELIEC